MSLTRTPSAVEYGKTRAEIRIHIFVLYLEVPREMRFTPAVSGVLRRAWAIIARAAREKRTKNDYSAHAGAQSIRPSTLNRGFAAERCCRCTWRRLPAANLAAVAGEWPVKARVGCENTRRLVTHQRLLPRRRGGQSPPWARAAPLCNESSIEGARTYVLSAGTGVSWVSLTFLPCRRPASAR